MTDDKRSFEKKHNTNKPPFNKDSKHGKFKDRGEKFTKKFNNRGEPKKTFGDRKRSNSTPHSRHFEREERLVNARQAALETLFAVIVRRQSLNGLLEATKARVFPADQALYQALVYGTLREYPALVQLRNSLLSVELDKNQPSTGIILNLGLYQLLRMDLGDHGVLNETVRLAEKNGIRSATGLVNAILRRVTRERAGCEHKLNQYRIHNIPTWLLTPYKTRAAELANEAIKQPPLTIRVRDDREAWLANNPHIATANPMHPQAVTLNSGMDVHAIAGFDEGQVSIQDAAAQHAATILDAQNGHYVLDACAAPGGKTGHILERAPEAKLIALDHDNRRLNRVQENLDRLGLTATLTAADAAEVESWWDNKKFDRILLDAPCSGSGIIRRHPDIPYLRTPEDLKQLPKVQMRLLKSLWTTLAEGGRLLYTTCSILPRENQQLIEQFLLTEPTAELIPVQVPFSKDTGHGTLHLPDTYGDGFFYALLQKKHP